VTGPAFEPRPVTLEGARVRLEPLAESHAPDLFEAGRDPGTWRYMSRGRLESLEDALRWIAEVRAGVEAGRQVAFAVIPLASGRAVGSTRYFDIRRRDRALEIGHTWLGPEARRTGINTGCKYLLLRHAFEDLGAFRVQLKTDARNETSQRAIERIGGVREGVLRRHILMPDGHVRDTVYYSVLDSEWPSVKLRLERMLARG
jgi:N-acetyltransferase